ncbi:MAG TPA: o-succinylbenzoate synthase [Pyrinomonadaceae bacterium]|nr:o-succinylbenzoate synthase [Pyrinomonadaceae bacterium]
MRIVTAKVERKRLRIESVALRRVRVPLLEPFRISNGVVAEKDAVLVGVRTTEGVEGWGEASPMSGSFYSADTPEGAWRALRETLVPLALGAGEIDARQFYLKLREVQGGPFAKAGLEGALWDAHARTLGVPLCELLGGRARPVASGVAIGIYDTVEELIERVARYVSEGYRRVKIKIQPGWDVGPVAAVRARFPAVPLMVDANAAYTLADAAVFRELDAHELLMIEQPLARDAHAEAAELQRQLRTPLCADESAESLDALEEIIKLGSARVVNIKVQRVGGLGEALLMLARARGAGLGCWVGTMPELGVASAQGLHFAALEGFDYPTDIEASARWYEDDLVEPAITIDGDGFIHIPVGAGTGYAVSREKVERHTVAAEEFTA